MKKLQFLAVLTMRDRMKTKRSLGFGLGCLVALGLVFGGMESAHAAVVPGDNTFVLDFVANGDAGGNLSNFPVAVYWKWDGNQTLGIRMETPNTGSGFPGGNGFWSFNIFCGFSSPGGLDSSGSNTSSITPISVGGAFTASSSGAYGVAVDAIEATWVQPCNAGPFDPSQTAIYIQLTIGGDNFPSNGYRIPDYEAQGGTYSNPPDFFTVGSFCGSAQGMCAQFTFQLADSDGDGVLDNVDQCPSSTLDNISLKPNQYAQNLGAPGFGPFEVGPGNDQSVVYDITTTHGCTCEQIIVVLGVGEGHSKKGCSPSVMEDFTGISANPDRKAGKGRN